MSLFGPAVLRISNTGAPSPMNPPIWETGIKVAPGTMLNGMTAAEWLCTIATTSGRAR